MEGHREVCSLGMTLPGKAKVLDGVTMERNDGEKLKDACMLMP